MEEDRSCCEPDRKLSRRALLLSHFTVAYNMFEGLLANQLFGFWQADPVVGIFIGVWLAREGIETLKEGKLCSC